MRRHTRSWLAGWLLLLGSLVKDIKRTKRTLPTAKQRSSKFANTMLAAKVLPQISMTIQLYPDIKLPRKKIGTYVPKQKFDIIRISVLRDITKTEKNHPY